MLIIPLMIMINGIASPGAIAPGFTTNWKGGDFICLVWHISGINVVYIE